MEAHQDAAGWVPVVCLVLPSLMKGFFSAPRWVELSAGCRSRNCLEKLAACSTMLAEHSADVEKLVADTWLIMVERVVPHRLHRAYEAIASVTDYLLAEDKRYIIADPTLKRGCIEAALMQYMHAMVKLLDTIGLLERTTGLAER